MTSSNGNVFRVTGPLWGESTGSGGFPSPRPMSRGFDILFDLCLNKRLSKQSRRQWFEAPSCSLWRHCSGIIGSYQLTTSHTVSVAESVSISWNHLLYFHFDVWGLRGGRMFAIALQRWCTGYLDIAMDMAAVKTRFFREIFIEIANQSDGVIMSPMNIMNTFFWKRWWYIFPV